MNAGIRHETPGLEKKNNLFYTAIAVARGPAFGGLWGRQFPEPQIPQGNVKMVR